MIFQSVLIGLKIKGENKMTCEDLLQQMVEALNQINASMEQVAIDIKALKITIAGGD